MAEDDGMGKEDDLSVIKIFMIIMTMADVMTLILQKDFEAKYTGILASKGHWGSRHFNCRSFQTSFNDNNE